jgi:choline dehydrogenase-like flavoprotein
MWGEQFVRHLEEYPNFVVLGTEGESLPNPDNRVELSDEVDELGVPRPLVTFGFGPNERAMRDEIHGIGQAILEAAGAVEVLVSKGNDHTMGGCRMGADRTSSVVDRDLKAHDHPNLYVCDASVFVTSGGAQPSQTIMALATRLADHLESGARSSD